MIKKIYTTLVVRNLNFLSLPTRKCSFLFQHQCSYPPSVTILLFYVLPLDKNIYFLSKNLRIDANGRTDERQRRRHFRLRRDASNERLFPERRRFPNVVHERPAAAVELQHDVAVVDGVAEGIGNVEGRGGPQRKRVERK